MNKKQSGMSVLSLVLIIGVVGVLALSGWWLFGQGSTSSPAASQNSRASTAKKSATQTNSQAGIAPGDQYLVIREWGVKLQMADADKVTYVMHGTPNGSPDANMITSRASLRLKDGLTTSEACKDLGIALTQMTEATYSIKIGNYSYGYEGAPGACDDSSVDALRAKIIGNQINTGAMSAL